MTHRWSAHSYASAQLRRDNREPCSPGRRTTAVVLCQRTFLFDNEDCSTEGFCHSTFPDSPSAQQRVSPDAGWGPTREAGWASARAIFIGTSYSRPLLETGKTGTLASVDCQLRFLSAGQRAGSRNLCCHGTAVRRTASCAPRCRRTG